MFVPQSGRGMQGSDWFCPKHAIFEVVGESPGGHGHASVGTAHMNIGDCQGKEYWWGQEA